MELGVWNGQEIVKGGASKILRRETEAFGLDTQLVSLRGGQLDGELHERYCSARARGLTRFAASGGWRDNEPRAATSTATRASLARWLNVVLGGRGYATHALHLLLPYARAEGLAHIDLTTTVDNVASQRVIEANGGILLGRFQPPPAYHREEGIKFRIVLA